MTRAGALLASLKFGAEYEAFRANVPRWIPRVRAWRGPAGAGRP